MEEIKEIVEEYEKLHKLYEYMGIGEAMPKDWADTLTIEKIAQMRNDPDWVLTVAQKIVNKLDELEAAMQPYGYHENTVNTIEEYMAQGFSAKEAPKAQRYDTLWNKWVNGQATPNEIAEMEAIAEELGL